MTRRRFFNLLYGLSPNSLFWLANKNKENEIKDPEKAEEALLRMFNSVNN